jgi:hypothetical protein
MSVSTAAELAHALKGKRSGKGWLCHCLLHKDRHPSFYVKDGPDGRICFRCFAGCDWHELRAELVRRDLLPGKAPRLDRVEVTRRALERERKLREERVAAEAEALAIWRPAVPIELGDLVDRYFGNRGLPMPRDGWPRSLRIGLHTGSTDRSWPALIAAACRWPERTPCAVQVTPLRDPGVKAWQKPARLTFGWPEGAAVRLTPWEPGRRIVLIEGVEDGLAVLGACPEVTPWAVLGAGNADSVRLPDGAEVTLCLDGDEAGRRAAVSAVKELWRRGHRVSVAKLPDGFDPLDVLRSGAR